MRNKQQLKKLIEFNTGLILADISTFNFLRYEKPDLINEKGLGGGNILSVIGLFALINYLAKIYKIIQSGKLPKRNFTDTEGFTEKDAFLRLLTDLPSQLIVSGDVDRDVVWNALRDYPAHMGNMREGYQAATIINSEIGGTYEEIEKSIANNNDYAIFKNPVTNSIVCVTDLLQREVNKIIHWISNDIINESQNDNITKAIEWLQI